MYYLARILVPLFEMHHVGHQRKVQATESRMIFTEGRPRRTRAIPGLQGWAEAAKNPICHLHSPVQVSAVVGHKLTFLEQTETPTV